MLFFETFLGEVQVRRSPAPHNTGLPEHPRIGVPDLVALIHQNPLRTE
jgi:hypothetical protein